MYLLRTYDSNGAGDVSSELWEVIWRQTNVVHSGGGWRESEHIGEIFYPTKTMPSGDVLDVYYAAVVGWSCPAGSTPVSIYHDEVSTKSGDLGLGQSWGVIESTSYDPLVPFAVGDYINYGATQSSATTPKVFLLSLETIDLNNTP